MERKVATRVGRRHLGFLAGGGLLVLAGCGTGTQAGTPGAPRTAGSSAGAEFTNPDLKVSVAWLQQHLRDPKVRVVDARPAAEYEKGHIPGAVSLPVADTFDPGQEKNYPDSKEKLEALLTGKGIGNDVRVIAYDNGRETAGPRLFWTLEYLGHNNVAVLDGGLKAWQDAKGELTTEAPTVEPATFVSQVDPAKLPTKEQCEVAIGDPTKVILDARSPEEYRGEDVRAKFGGHIPGAVNIDWRENFTADSLLKEAPALRTLYESKGVTRDKEVIAHCQTGQRSSATYWALRLLGYSKVGNYAGSWVEWGNDPDTKKTQG
ncbi:MAG TPA: sulfurtransferase [Chloroflexota bacterium]|nr:sulfurtransferase [Chloroflexota bacterium]